MNHLLRSSLAAMLALAAAPRAPAATEWADDLSLANGGWWPVRLSVEATNTAPADVAGEPSSIPLDALAGEPAASVRVCDATGRELLHDLRDRSGEPRRSGAIAPGDRLTIPVSCPARGSALFHVYAGNPAAWAMPDTLPSGFANGGLEAGRTRPADWSASSTDAVHRLFWEPGAGRNGSRGFRAEVDAGAAPDWTQWRQSDIPLSPGRSYEVRGWVRTENLAGDAGWYVHVNGDRPQLVNRTLSVHNGTRDWTEVSASFTAPTGSVHATIGTVLHGTGRAWFDDVRLSTIEGGTGVSLRCGAPERYVLAPPPPAAPAKPSAEFPIVVTVLARNPSDLPADRILVAADLRPAFGHWYKLAPDARFHVTDAATGTAIPDAFRMDRTLLFTASLPARSAREFRIAFAPGTTTPEGENLAAHVRCAAGPSNLAGFPNLGNPADGWTFNGNRAACAATVIRNAPGGRGLEFRASPSNTAWTGWVSPGVPVRPGATYLYAGLVQTEGAEKSASLHLHLHKPAGGIVASGGMLSTHSSPATGGWTVVSTTFRAPADAARAMLHLTMNTGGTLRHAGILLCETRPAQVVATASANAAPKTGLHVWQANPLVKIFRADPPGPAATAVAVECARREREAVQLAVYAGRALRNLRATVTPLRSASGDTLPAATVERVGYVPVDHPSGYFQDDGAAWEAKRPRHAGRTDGWAGEWPDPLIPAANGAPCELGEGLNQPYWITLAAQTNTPAGEYRGEAVFEADGATAVRVPVTVRVLSFELPARPSLRAILDLRTGPGGDLGTGIRDREGRRAWLRFLAEHRVAISEIEPAPSFTRTNGVVRLDTTGYDDEARFCLDELQMSVAYTPHFLYGFGWAYPPRKIFGLEPFTPEYNEAYRQSIAAFAAYAKSRGWFDRFVYYISDEPHFDHAFVVDQMKQLCAMSHEAAPGLPIYSSTWRHCPAWDDALDIWGVGQYGCFPVAEMERLRAKGRRMWITCDGQMATDTPYLATERMLPWYCFKYGADCFEFWGVSWWTYDPWQTGWHTFIRQSDDGQRHYWIRYPNGDGFLTYPGGPVGVRGPVSSIRMEQVREGLEDYEALRTLRELAATSPAAAARAAEALRGADALVTIPNAGGLRSTDILPDPDRLPALRHAVNEAISALMK